MRRFKSAMILGFVAMMVGCATAPPTPANPNNLCALFQERRDWYRSTNESFQRWGMPIHVQMAIIYQESGFRADARPPRWRLLGFIPMARPSSAYGYPQALDETWDWYRTKTNQRGADRDDFADAVDFVGWYGQQSQLRLGISKWDAYRQYLAYHEGHGGYARGSYRNKDWLIEVAWRVETTARRYSQQLATCKASLADGFDGWQLHRTRHEQKG